MAPPTRARAPQTARLRSRLRRGIVKNAPKLPARKPESTSEFRDSFDYYWFSFLNTEESVKGDKEDAIVQFEQLIESSGTNSVEKGEEVDRLCHILKQISDEFAAKGRSYISMAANAAVSLVRNGRQDEINPGLWRYIRQHEEANTDKCFKKKLS